MRLSEPQRDLLEEINETGILYVRTYSRYGRTAVSLENKGLLTVVERDFTRLSMHGYSVTDEGRAALGIASPTAAGAEAPE